MIMPPEFSIFMKNRESKTTLLNLIEQVYMEHNTKLQDRVIYFPNETQMRPTAEKSVQMILKIVMFFSDHVEADTKLIALVKGYECGNNEKLLVRSPSGDIDIIVLFMLQCSGSNIFFDTGHGEAGKIIDISCPMLSKSRVKRNTCIFWYQLYFKFFPERQEKILENIIEVSGIS